MKLTPKPRPTSSAFGSYLGRGVMGVIQPHASDRGSIDQYVPIMAVGRMALALRDDPPQALQLALLRAFQRGSRRR